MGILRTKAATRSTRLQSSQRMWLLLPLLFVVQACLADSAQEQDPAVQGPQEREDGDEEHRPGQPCLLCHGPDHFPQAPGEEIFLVAGTVYAFVDDEAEDGLSDVEVKIIDANQREVTVTSNKAGNFMISEGGPRENEGWLKISGSLQFPLEVSIIRDGDEQKMRTKIAQEGSCSRCHKAKPDVDSVGRVFLFEATP